MKRTDHADYGLIMTAFLAGAAFGSAVSLLMAPQSGERTRRLLRRRAEDSLDRLSDAGHDLADRGRELYGRGARLVEQKVKNVS